MAERATTESPSAPEPKATKEATSALVEDHAEPAPGQARKSVFIARLRRDLTATVDHELRGTALSGQDCPCSGAFHHELGLLVDSSTTLPELNAGLADLAQRWQIPTLPQFIAR